jgi:DNA-binding NarL/FixJ family response regulator
LTEAIAATCPLEDRTAELQVFPRFTVDGAEKAMRAACKLAEIPRFSPHDLRHRRLSLWHGQGVPAKELAERAGHARASMSLDVYSHVMPLDELPQESLEALLVWSPCGLDEAERARNGAIEPTADFPHTILQAVVENGQGRKEITCLIVDDHEVVREGLRLSLSRAPHIRVVGEASDGATAVALAERRKPDVVIMDVRMPGMDGLEATKILTEKVPETAVLIFTAYSERSLLGRGLDSGAKGYILKEAPHQTLLKAIDKVVAGDGFVDPALMPAFLGDARDEMLTGREREILQLLADGMSNADVAARLFISQETVKSHVRHILTKLEADTRTHAVAIALRDAIID